MFGRMVEAVESGGHNAREQVPAAAVVVKVQRKPSAYGALHSIGLQVTVAVASPVLVLEHKLCVRCQGFDESQPIVGTVRGGIKTVAHPWVTEHVDGCREPDSQR